MSNDTKPHQRASRMRGLGLVTAREIKVRGLSKANLVSLGITVVVIGILAALPSFFDGDSQHEVGFAGETAASMQEHFEAAAEASDVSVEITRYDTIAQAEEAVEEGDIHVAVADGNLYVDGSVATELELLLESAHAAVSGNEQLIEAGLDPAEVFSALNVEPLATVQLGEDGSDQGMRAFIGTFVALILMFTIMMPTMYVAMGVVEEKSSRIVEILLTSLKPWQLLGGKILGLGVIGAVNVGVIIVTSLGVSAAVGTLPELPDGVTEVLGTMIIWWILGYAIFAAMAGAAGSLVSRQEDSNSVLTPVTMLIMVGYFGAIYALNDPQGPVAQALSIIPPFSAFTMPARQVAVDVPLWESLLAAGLLLVAAAGMLAVGSTIYKRSVMRTGSRVKLMEVLRS
ncbi:ABC transporter permease [Natronoglycomyces albus]|uniref:ABC transporter permease n=1 Tax=Natronoglycomyces albus TaxID=2811108 RepID=A0A895XKV5_9ACTN|nr:ABC transporter permease [Natronoglycomyces albus]QSB05697.1 ABC transporter permease [Natronoglycomyces albus]